MTPLGFWSDVEVAIATVPERSRSLAELVQAVAAQAPGASIRVEVQDPRDGPRARIRRLYGRSRGLGWLVALEDDVRLAPDWGARIADWIVRAPVHPAAPHLDDLRAGLSAWFCRKDPGDGVYDSTDPAVAPENPQGFMPSACMMVVPSRWGPDLAYRAGAFWRENPQIEHHATDLALGVAAGDLGLSRYVVVPSAVQHRTDLESTNGARGDRVSASYLRAYGSDFHGASS